MNNYGPATEEKVAQVVRACERYGGSSIIALEGVPGTGKSFIASIAAQRVTNEPLLVREIQFHPGVSYEEFIEGMRIGAGGTVTVTPGLFLDWNERAWDDLDRKYVLLVEELSRANISAVLGELMTYLEHRERPFTTIYSRRPVKIAPNLVVLATYNPTDISALEFDAALLRRLRVIRCDPSIQQLAEMLDGRGLPAGVIPQLQRVFKVCEETFPDEYENLMPFGHGIFADIRLEKPDLNDLWEERIRRLLRRPLQDPHPFTTTIEEQYPWRATGYVLPPPPAAPPSSAAAVPAPPPPA